MAMDSVFRVSLVLDMVDNMTSKVSGAADSVSPALNRLNDTFGTMQKAGAAMTGVGTAVATACLATVTSTFDTQDALAEVASLGVEDLGALEKAAKNFSDTWAGTSKADFISASYDIKSGIASLSDEGVAEFTQLAALTAKATKATAGDMTSLFATGYGIYKNYYSDLSDLEFGEMFSAGIATAVKNYKTSGTQMADAIKTIGATATNANVPMEEQLAVLGQMQATMSGSEAGTKYKAFLNAAAGAGDKLGLNFLDANNQLLSMPEILEILRGKYGDTIDALEKKELKEAFGTDESIALIDLLYNNTDQLKTGIDDLHTSMDAGVETTQKMAEAINDTPAQKFQVLKQQLHNATEELGQGLLPAANAGLEVITSWVQKGSDWIANNQELVGTIMRIVAIVAILLIVGGGIVALVGTIGKTLAGLKSALDLARTATGGLTGAFLSSPLTWVLGIVLALVAAFKLCGGDVSELGEIFGSVLGKIGGIVASVVGGIFEQLPQFLQFGLELVLNIISGIAAQLPGLIGAGIGILFSILSGLIQMLPGIAQAGVELLNMLVNAIVVGLPALLDAGLALVQTLVSGIAILLPQLVETGIQVLLMLLTGILDNIPRLLETGITLITMLIQGVAQNLPSLIETGLSVIMMILQGILTAVPKILVAAVQLIPMIVEGIATNLSTLISSGIKMIGQILAGLIKGIPALLKMIPGIFGQIIDAVLDIDWLGLGGDLIGGIADGFIAGFTSLVDTVKGLWDDFVGWFSGDKEEYIANDIEGYVQTMDGRYTNDGGENYYTAQQLAAQGVDGAAAVVARQTELAGTDVGTPPETTATPAADVVTDVQADTTAMQAQGQESIDALIAGVEGAAPAAEDAAAQSAADIMSKFGLDSSDPSETANAMMADLTAGITDGAPAAQTSAEDAAAGIMSAFHLDGSEAAVSADEVMEGLLGGILTRSADVEGAASQAGQGILDAFNMDTADATTAGTDLVNSVADSISANAAGAQEAATSAGQGILDAFHVDASGMLEAGSGLVEELTSGITSGAGDAAAAASDTADGIMEALGIGTATAPEEGVRVMADMASGITSGGEDASGAMQSSAADVMKVWEDATSNAASLGSNLMSRIRSGITSAGGSLVSEAQGIANRIRSAFEGMTIRVPAPKLPHINVNYSTVGSGDATAQVPDFSVQYYAKGGIMTAPTLFGMNGNSAMVGGEAGEEAILPLDTLWARMRGIVEDVIGRKPKEDEGSQAARELLREFSPSRKEAKTVQPRENDKKETVREKARVVIQKLELKVDPSAIDELQKLKKLIDEIQEEYGPEPA